VQSLELKFFRRKRGFRTAEKKRNTQMELHRSIHCGGGGGGGKGCDPSPQDKAAEGEKRLRTSACS